MYKILMVEDDKNIRKMIGDFMCSKSEGLFEIHTAETGEEGLTLAYENEFDLLLLDVMLPEIDGFEICKEVRRTSDVPILFLTACVDESNILKGYALGCDDYILKPFSLSVLFEKIKATIKRSKGIVREKLLTVEALSLNPNNGIVMLEEQELKLTAKEFAILRKLMENKGSIVSREALIKSVWSWDSQVDERVLDVHIRNIRKALGAYSKLIKTAVGRGYRIGE